MADYFSGGFGIDTAGQFSGTADSLSKNPFTTSAASSSSMAFPLIPLAAAGISAAGSIFGASKAASATEQAAEKAAEATKQAAKEATRRELAKEWAGFGFDYLTQRYNTGAGGAANRLNAFKQAQQEAEFQAYNPAMAINRGISRFDRVQDYASQLSAAMPGYVSPLNLF
jgi:hypothetical protein